VYAAHGFAGLAAALNKGHGCLRVAQQQAQELAAGVAGSADYACFNHVPVLFD
jgi:hypothetical protein